MENIYKLVKQAIKENKNKRYFLNIEYNGENIAIKGYDKRLQIFKYKGYNLDLGMYNKTYTELNTAIEKAIESIEYSVQFTAKQN